MGVTGSGKTSIVNLTPDSDVTSGEVLLDSIDQSGSCDPLKPDNHSGYRIFLFSDTITDNIKTGNRGRNQWESVERKRPSARRQRFRESLGEKYVP